MKDSKAHEHFLVRTAAYAHADLRPGSTSLPVHPTSQLSQGTSASGVKGLFAHLLLRNKLLRNVAASNSNRYFLSHLFSWVGMRLGTAGIAYICSACVGPGLEDWGLEAGIV